MQNNKGNREWLCVLVPMSDTVINEKIMSHVEFDVSRGNRTDDIVPCRIYQPFRIITNDFLRAEFENLSSDPVNT